MIGKACATAVLVVLLASAAWAADVLELANPGLATDTDDQEAPNGWLATYTDQHEVERMVCRDDTPSWKIWYDGSIYQCFKGEFAGKKQLRFGGYLYMAADDRLRRGLKSGVIALEFYDAEDESGRLISRVLAHPALTADSPDGEWVKSWSIAVIPANTHRIHFTMSCENGHSGDGSFFVDDLFLEEMD